MVECFAKQSVSKPPVLCYNIFMETRKLLEKPFRLMAILGCVFVIAILVVNVFTGFSYEQCILPFPKIITYSALGLSLILCILTCIFYNRHFLYFAALEVFALSNIYTGRIYTALFITSILFILLLVENHLASRLRLWLYLTIEILKLVLTVPYGVRSFFEYIGITLFSLATIGCINLLFRHAYDKKDSAAMDLDNYKFSDRQKDCIKEIVLNNTTIKALAINHKVSESAIKKDLSHIYNVLGITGKADLKALFIGYEF